MGRILSRGCPKGPIHFLILQFLCSTWQPFLRPDPHTEWPARAGAVKAGPSIGRPPTGLALMALSTTAYLLWVGMTTSEGSSHVVHEHSRHILLFGWGQTQTMMQ